MAPPIRVLVVDDSAFARKVVREVLQRDPAIEVVGIARDGLEALEKIAELKPDVITLDLMMPDLDGLGVLKALPKENAPKVIIVSVSGSETELVIEALARGAVDVVTKPTALPTDRLYDLSTELVDKVKIAASARPKLADSISLLTESRLLRNPFGGQSSQTKIVLIGTSTGGPQALSYLFSVLPAQLPVPFAIALHIPAGYTAPLAARLSQSGGVQIVEATEGLELRAGCGVIAPGGMHLRIRQREGRFFAEVSRDPESSLHHPSVDVLFESAAEEIGHGVLAVVLTGMGNDGTEGAKKIRARGGRVLAESESSCVVYGMPRSVVEAGVTTGQTTLAEMPELILKEIFGEIPPIDSRI